MEVDTRRIILVLFCLIIGLTGCLSQNNIQSKNTYSKKNETHSKLEKPIDQASNRNTKNESNTTKENIDYHNSVKQASFPKYFQQANIQHFGFVAYDDGWLYFSNSSDEWKLYKSRINGENKQKLFDYPARDINISDGWIYFRDEIYDDLNCTLRIKKDGSSQQVLNEYTAYGIYVTDQFVYYVDADDGRLYKMKKDGSDKTMLTSEEVNGYWINNNDIYFRDPDKGNLILKKENQNSTIFLDSDIGDILIIDQYIYYIDISDNSSLYKIRTDGSEKEKISQIQMSYLNYCDGWLVYRNDSNDGELYKIRLDGTDNTKICNDVVSEINVVDKWIFYRNSSDCGKLYRISIDGKGKQVF